MAIATARKKRKKRPAEDESFVDMVAFASLMTILLAFFYHVVEFTQGQPREETAEEALSFF